MSFLLLNNCPSIALRTAIKDSHQGQLWAYLDILSAVVVNLGKHWSGRLMPINVSTVWMGITIIVNVCGMSAVCQMFINGLVIAEHKTCCS